MSLESSHNQTYDKLVNLKAKNKCKNF